MARSSNKRERLVASAKRLIHEQGYNRTTLADIAQDARVPLGNVYYYFKTKEALAQAVLDERIQLFEESIARWDTLPSPRERLLALLDELPEDRQKIARYGCPVGSLCQELDKSRSSLAIHADGIIQRQLQWISEQFQQLGHADKAAGLAMQFMVSLQGLHLMANVMNDPEVAESQLSSLRHWLGNLCA